MKNYNNYIFESLYPGIEVISEYQFKEYLKNLKEFDISDNCLLRGVELGKSPYYLINYTNRTRIIGSKLSLIMEFHDSWKDYPKRTKSIIMTNKLNIAKFYADPDKIVSTPMNNVYRIIPFDGSKFGFAPEKNYKLCFTKCKTDFKNYDNVFYKLGELCDGKFNLFEWSFRIKIIKTNYTKFMNNIDKTLEYARLKNKKSKLLNFDNANELINYYFNPEDNRFMLYDYESLMRSMIRRTINLHENDAYEIWTDSPCLLARYNKINKKSNFNI